MKETTQHAAVLMSNDKISKYVLCVSIKEIFLISK